VVNVVRAHRAFGDEAAGPPRGSGMAALARMLDPIPTKKETR